MMNEKNIHNGMPEGHAAPVEICCGNLRLFYEQGTVRKITFAGTEIIRNIYPAVRDKNWATIEPVIENERIQQNEADFIIQFNCIYKSKEVDFRSKYIISGNNYSLRFEMQGKACSDFLKNRIGLNVLHPIENIQGKELNVVHADGSNSKGVFPKYISPHQPFKNCRKMNWFADENIEANLVFEGEIFEMEDQRNWTDASYKTYCTPLDLPFPVTIKNGDFVDQAVELTISPKQKAINTEQKQNYELFVPDLTQVLPLPKFGICKSTEFNVLSETELSTLHKIPFHHYTIDLNMAHNNTNSVFKCALFEADKLNCLLKIIIHATNDQTKLSKLIDDLVAVQSKIYQVVLLNQKHRTDNEIINNIVPLFREKLPAIPIGGGTDAYFAELNRNDFDFDALDFVNYTICPQVHAFDNTSLIETLQGQIYTVESAKHKYKLPVSVSSVSLKQRFNIAATTEEIPDPNTFPPQVDVRQTSEFCAAWTLGSIKSLAEAGAESVSWYQTVGMRGIIQGDSPSPFPEIFKSHAGMIFPVFEIFNIIAHKKEAQIIRSISNAPDIFSGICLTQNNQIALVVGNYTEKEIEIAVRIGDMSEQLKLQPYEVRIKEY